MLKEEPVEPVQASSILDLHVDYHNTAPRVTEEDGNTDAQTEVEKTQEANDAKSKPNGPSPYAFPGFTKAKEETKEADEEQATVTIARRVGSYRQTAQTEES